MLQMIYGVNKYMRIGKVTESVLNRSVLKLIKSDSNKKSAAGRSDCAYSIDENGIGILTAVSTFTAVSKDASYYAVHNAANNIFCQGGKPLMVVLNIMLPAEVEESELKAIMRSAISAANELGIAIEGGHTEVTDAVSRPLVSAVVTGEISTNELVNSDGRSECGSLNALNGIEPDKKSGLDIVMTKWAGIEGTAILAKEQEEKLAERLPDYMIKQSQEFKGLVSIARDSDIAMQNGAMGLHDISSGGIFAALWDISARYGFGLEVDLKKIPIRQETVEITNHLGVNPCLMHAGGSLIMVAEDGEALCRAFHEADINAQIIGFTTATNDKIIKNDDETRYLDKPQADELLRQF